MKFSSVFLASVLAVSAVQPAIAAPSYHETCSADGLCVDHTTNQISSLSGRQLPSLGSLLGSLPILGPILQPLLPLLGAIGLSNVGVSAQDMPKLDDAQLTALANLETILLGAVQQITSSRANGTTPTSLLPIKARGLLPLGSLLSGLPIIGPILAPLLPLLGSIGLASVDAPNPDAVYSMALNDDQQSTLNQLQSILEQEVPGIMPESDGTPQPSPTPSSDGSSDDTHPAAPSDVSPNDTSSGSSSNVSPSDDPSATPSDTSNDADSDTPSDVSPAADAPSATPAPAASPEGASDDSGSSDNDSMPPSAV